MQKDITNETLELIRRTSSSLPKDVEDRLRASIEKEEPGSAARGALETIMQNIACECDADLPGYWHADILCPLPGGVVHAQTQRADPLCVGGSNQKVLYATERRGCHLR